MLHNLAAYGCEIDTLVGALQKSYTEAVLELANLAAERRLTYVASLRGAAKMAVFG
jgi:hypothetical protein